MMPEREREREREREKERIKIIQFSSIEPDLKQEMYFQKRLAQLYIEEKVEYPIKNQVNSHRKIVGLA